MKCLKMLLVSAIIGAGAPAIAQDIADENRCVLKTIDASISHVWSRIATDIRVRSAAPSAAELGTIIKQALDDEPPVRRRLIGDYINEMLCVDRPIEDETGPKPDYPEPDWTSIDPQCAERLLQLLKETEQPPPSTQAWPPFSQADLAALYTLVAAVKGGNILVGFVADQCPSGWEPYEEAYNKFLMGAGDTHPAGKPGGDAEHSHKGRTAGGEGNVGHDGGTDKPYPSIDGHTHGFQTSPAHTLPPFVGVLFCQPSDSVGELRQRQATP